MDAKTTGIVAYITWIGLVLAFVLGDREGAKFHLNQALVIWAGGSSELYSCIGWLWGIFCFICAVMGFISAVNGEGEGGASAGRHPSAEVRKDRGPRTARVLLFWEGSSCGEARSPTGRRILRRGSPWRHWRRPSSSGSHWENPTVSRCWVWEHWHVYCPGCGGTRALIALAHAQLGTALRYHPPVVITLALAGAYLLTQTVWRLRGRRGWAPPLPPLVAGGHRGAVPGQLSGADVLWLGFGIAM